jgi:hypothetical protein
VLASGEVEPFAIAVDPSACGKVFWASRACGPGDNPVPGSVRMIDKAGGGAVTIGQGCLLDLAGDATHVAWAGYTEVVAARIDGTNAEPVATSKTGIASRVAPLGSSVYWASNGVIGRYAIGVGPCTVDCERIAALPALIMALAADEAGVYVNTYNSESDGDGGVWFTPPDAGPTTIAPTKNASTLVVTPDRVYYGDDDGIWGVARDGGGRSIIVGERTFGLAVHGDRLYWTTGTEVRSANVLGGDVQTLAADRVFAFGIAVDDAAIYWVERGTGPDNADGRVVRLAR